MCLNEELVFFFSNSASFFFICRTLIFILGLSITDAFGKFGLKGWYHWTLEEQWAVIYAQNAMLVSFVWYLGKV